MCHRYFRMRPCSFQIKATVSVVHLGALQDELKSPSISGYMAKAVLWGGLLGRLAGRQGNRGVRIGGVQALFAGGEEDLQRLYVYTCAGCC